MFRKCIILSFLLSGTALSMAATGQSSSLPELCQQLSTALIDLSNHQAKPECQGSLGRAAAMVSVAGNFIQANHIALAKQYLGYSHEEFDRLASYNCDYQDKIQFLKHVEEDIAAQV